MMIKKILPICTKKNHKPSSLQGRKKETPNKALVSLTRLGAQSLRGGAG